MALITKKKKNSQVYGIRHWMGCSEEARLVKRQNNMKDLFLYGAFKKNILFCFIDNVTGCK